MLKDKLKSKGHLKYVLKDEAGNVLLERESYNFMCPTLSRILTEQLGAFMNNWGSNEAMKPGFGGFSTVYPSATKLSDGSVKFALALTDNTTIIEPLKESSTLQLPGRVIGMTRGVKAVGTQEEAYIESIKILQDGGIEIKAQIGKGVVGQVGTVGLVLPKDLNFNTDGTDKLYDYPLGDLIVNDEVSSSGYISNIVEFNNKIYFATVYSSGWDREMWLWCYDRGVITKVFTYTISSTDAITLQVVDDELWCILNSSTIYVLSSDLTYLRTESTTGSIDCVIDSKGKGVLFVDGEYVYGVYGLSTGSKTLSVAKGKLQSAGSEAITTKTLNYTDEAHAYGIIYGNHKEGTKIVSATGKEVDISTLFREEVDSVDSAVGVTVDGYPRALVKGSKIGDVWYGRHFRDAHDINTIEGFNTSLNMCNSVYYKEKDSYLIKCNGGNALTCNVITEQDGGVINKTANDTLTITYTIY